MFEHELYYRKSARHREEFIALHSIESTFGERSNNRSNGKFGHEMEKEIEKEE